MHQAYICVKHTISTIRKEIDQIKICFLREKESTDSNVLGHKKGSKTEGN